MGSTARLILPRSQSAEVLAAPKPAPVPPAPSLPYEVEQPWYGQRRAFRIIVSLLLLNIVAVTSITWGPITVRAWQESRARAKAAAAQAKANAARTATTATAVAARQAAVKAAMAFQMPPGRVVYTEDPDEASRLLLAPGGGYSAVPQSMRTPNLSLPPSPVLAVPTPELRSALRAFVPNPPEGSLALHELKTPDGTSRVIWVWLRASHSSTQSSTTTELWMNRELRAMVLNPTVPSDGGFIRESWSAQIAIEQPEARRLRIPAPQGIVRQPTQITRPGEILRLLAGRADPNDPARLLIDYTLDGKAGTIAVTLRADDRLRFEPDRGTAVIERFDTSGARVVWTP